MKWSGKHFNFVCLFVYLSNFWRAESLVKALMKRCVWPKPATSTFEHSSSLSTLTFFFHQKTKPLSFLLCNHLILYFHIFPKIYNNLLISLLLFYRHDWKNKETLILQSHKLMKILIIFYIKKKSNFVI